MLIDLPVNTFLAETGSDSPAPGGGSVSALAGALGAALAIMVANLTVGNEKYASAEEEVKAGRASLEPLLTALEQYIDADTEAFNAVMSAFKLPKAQDAEKAARNKAIQDAMKHAADLPLKVAETCTEVMGFAVNMLRIGNSNAASDAAVAGRMAYAGMWGAVYNVRINIASVKDEEFTRNKRERIAQVLAKGERLMGELCKAADEKIGI